MTLTLVEQYEAASQCLDACENRGRELCRSISLLRQKLHTDFGLTYGETPHGPRWMLNGVDGYFLNPRDALRVKDNHLQIG